MEGDEFLLWCLDQEDRYELVNGVPVKMIDARLMVGASRAHDRIVVNLIASLLGQLVDPKLPGATLISRTETDWTHRNFDTLADVIDLPHINGRLTMAAIFETVEFVEREVT